MSEAPRAANKAICLREDAEAVLRRLREAGHETYFAGGCVRDLLLGIEPKDYDVATSAHPEAVRKLFSRTQAVGAAFGVILVKQGRSQVEVATFRSDDVYEDGRRPVRVHFTTAQEDAKRRDFTINGLFLDPVDGRVIDYVGGQEDLAARRIRAIGQADARFEEDHLRLLRAVRFAARFGFEIEEATAEAIRRHAAQLARISPERIAEECRGMLTPVTRTRAWEMLGEMGLVGVIFRFLSEAPDADEHRTLEVEHRTSKIEHRTSKAALSRGVVFGQVAPGQTISMGLALAAGTVEYQLLQGGTGMDVRALLTRKAIRRAVRAMRQALRISNEESEQMEQILEGLPALLEDRPASVATRKRFLARPTAGASRRLLEALAAAGQHRDRIEALRGELAELEKTEVAPPPLITGDDLAAAGLVPGLMFKRILEAVYDAQLEGRIFSKADALGMGKRMGGRE